MAHLEFHRVRHMRTAHARGSCLLIALRLFFIGCAVDLWIILNGRTCLCRCLHGQHPGASNSPEAGPADLLWAPKKALSIYLEPGESHVLRCVPTRVGQTVPSHRALPSGSSKRNLPYALLAPKFYRSMGNRSGTR